MQLCSRLLTSDKEKEPYRNIAGPGFNYVSLILLSVSCCWAGIRMLVTDWLN